MTTVDLEGLAGTRPAHAEFGGVWMPEFDGVQILNKQNYQKILSHHGENILKFYVLGFEDL